MSFQIERDSQFDPNLKGFAQTNYTGHLFDGSMEVRYGPLTEEMPMPEKDENGAVLPRIPFRLLDDDSEVYYEGWLHDDWNCDNQLAALTWAQYDSGCTQIQVRRGDEWKAEIE